MERFADFLQTEKRLSKATIDSYIRDINLFADFLKKPLTEGTSEEIEAFFLYLKSLGRAPSTVLRFYASIHAYYRYLSIREGFSDDPISCISRPEYERRLPMILSSKEVDRFLSVLEGDTPKAIRDKAMLELLYATGIRVSELIGLNVEHVNLRRRMLTLHSGERKRTIPFGRPASAALNNYMKQARPYLIRGNGEVALFLSCNGTRMSRQGFWKLVKYYKNLACIDKEITPHMLRHSFAAHLLENGADLSFIQEMMGFVDPTSTAIYTKIIENKILDVYAKAHPRAN